MSLTPTIRSVSAMYGKMIREGYRTYHSNTILHKSDHFFNFCITAHSMREYYLEHLQILDKESRKPFYDEWEKHPFLVATADIANSTKHFKLREKSSMAKIPATKDVQLKLRPFVDILQDDSGNLFKIIVERKDISIFTSDGKTYALYQFTETVEKYWYEQLKTSGIRVRHPSLTQLIDSK
jgi:hypothetical protein